MTFRSLTENYIASVLLPSKIEIVSSSESDSSKVVKNLLTKRQKEHNVVLEIIKNRCNQKNLEIEDKIEKITENLKEDLERLKEQIDSKCFLVFECSDDEFIELEPTIFNELQSFVKDKNYGRFDLIENYYQNLKNLEKERSAELKKILNEAYQKLSKISHFLPYELLNFFEDEIQNLNQITLDNYRSYEKFTTNLKLQIQEEVRLYNLEFFDKKEKHKMATTMAKVKTVMDSYKSEQTMPVVSLNTFDAHFSDFPKSSTDVAVWSKQIQSTLDQLDADAKKLIDLYKTAVINVFHRFFEELKSITEALTKTSDEMLEVDAVDEEIYQVIIDDITQTYTCDVTELQKLWNSITTYMESNLKNTSIFLKGSAHLWYAHFSRCDKIKTIIMEDMKLLIAKHDKDAQDFDKKINTTLDKLREDSTIPTLDKHLKEANSFLDSIKNMYSNQCNAEIKLLEKYHNLLDLELDLLVSEIERFIEESAKDEYIQERRQSYEYEPIKNKEKDEFEDSNENLIPNRMKNCQFQVDAVNNWMFGLWEAIRQYLVTCRDEVNAQAQSWIDNITHKLKKRQEVRQSLHRPRYLRIKTMIYDERLNELKEHMDTFNRIEKAINQNVEDSRQLNQSCKEKNLEIVKSYEEALRGIEERLKKAQRSQQVASCIETTKFLNKETKKIFENFYQDCENLVQKKNKDSDNLISQYNASIKLFVEGGDYSRDEIKNFTKKLQKLKKQANGQFKKSQKAQTAIKNEIMKTFQNSDVSILERLEKSKNEFLHKEEICKKIKQLQNQIRQKAFATKFEIHRLDACIDYHINLTIQPIWSQKRPELIKKSFLECVEKIEILTKKITKPENYFAVLINLIDSTFAEIEKSTKVFYEQHSTIINKGKIPENFEVFMNEVKSSFDSFKLQVHIHCLDCAVDIIRHILKFLKNGDFSQKVEEFIEKLSIQSDNLEQVRSAAEIENLSGKFEGENFDTEKNLREINDAINQLLEFLAKNDDVKAVE